MYCMKLALRCPPISLKYSTKVLWSAKSAYHFCVHCFTLARQATSDSSWCFSLAIIWLKCPKVGFRVPVPLYDVATAKSYVILHLNGKVPCSKGLEYCSLSSCHSNKSTMSFMNALKETLAVTLHGKSNQAHRDSSLLTQLSALRIGFLNTFTCAFTSGFPMSHIWLPTRKVNSTLKY